MITIKNPDFDIQKIAGSGQCFRLRRDMDDCYTLIAHGRVLHISNIPEGCVLDCSQAEYHALWQDYFDLNTDYTKIRATVDPADAFLQRACDYGRGIRMLRQEPWEMLISFIISQRKNIPAIQCCIETICSRYGDLLEHAGEEKFCAFPSAERLSRLSEQEFRACSLGYRDKYVLAAAQMVASGQLKLNEIGNLPDDALFSALLAVPGVGEKVANCVMLFGYHRLSRFPRDVWINRVKEREYGGAFPLERYPDSAGVLQQYVFYYARSGEYTARLSASNGIQDHTDH